MLAVMLWVAPVAQLPAQATDRPVEAGGNNPAEPLQQAYALDAALADVYARVAPSVVVLQVRPKVPEESLSPKERLLKFFEAPGRLPESDPVTEGSGFLFRPDGYVMTNYHVIREGVDGDITALLQDGTRLPARLVGGDEQTDLAVLKIEGDNFAHIEFADSDQVRPGQFALAIGSPYELAYTATLGIVSALKRGELTPEGVYESYIQTDAAIHPGNSGGPLLDIRGRVIGINTMINGINRGLAFAVPSNMAARVADQLIDHGRVIRPWLGVGIVTLENDPALREKFPDLKTGVVVKSLQRGGPAVSSALKPADVILKVDGVPVRTTTDLQQEVLRKPVGQELALEVWRPTPNSPDRGQYRNVVIKTAEREVQAVAPARSGSESDEEVDRNLPVRVKKVTVNDLGVSLRSPESADRALIGNQPPDSGVLVEARTDVPGFPPNELLAGDIITGLEGEEVKNLQQFEEILSKSDASDGLLIEVVRDGTPIFLISQH